jgi:glycosyltransferase involved in cell wall biosynthesis
MVPPRNAGAFASAVAELLADPEKRKAMGEAGRHRATEQFSLDRMVGEMESLYEALAGGGR